MTMHQKKEVKKEVNDETLRHQEIVLKFIIKLASALLVIWVIFTFVFGIRQVCGEMMYPRLLDGDLTLYYRLESNYKIGDVVTFQKDGSSFWGRIVAQGGDSVDITSGGYLIVNGNVQQEEIFYLTDPQDADITYPYTVEDGSYFLLCDYRTAGIDSRTYGSVSKSEIDGKVIALLRRRGF
jgi:signal peptidase I